MAYTVRNQEREFTPAEAAAITGVSTALQRDWRRRGILPEKQSEGWSQFDVKAIIEMYVLRFFSEAGFSVKQVQDMTGVAILPVLGFLESAPGAIEVVGDNIPESIQSRILQDASTSRSDGRYLAAAHRPRVVPKLDSGDHFFSWARFRTLDSLGQFLDERGAEGCTVLDLQTIANRIIEHAGLPLFRVEVTRT